MASSGFFKFKFIIFRLLAVNPYRKRTPEQLKNRPLTTNNNFPDSKFIML